VFIGGEAALKEHESAEGDPGTVRLIGSPGASRRREKGKGRNLIQSTVNVYLTIHELGKKEKNADNKVNQIVCQREEGFD